MERRPPVPPFVFKILKPAELLALAGIVVGVALKYLKMEGSDEVLMVALSSLSAVYFMMAFQPPVESEENDQPSDGGFGDLLGGMILPKVGWIASSVTTIGICFSLLHLKGADQQLLVGCSTLSIAVAASLYFLTTGTKRTPILMNMLYRAAPILVFGLFVYMNLPPK